MYYTEITKIIEAGIRKDQKKVASYSRLLAKKLDDDGEKRASTRILSVLDKMSDSYAVMDTLTALPVDQESRLDIANIDYAPNVENIILSKSVQEMLDDFRDTIKSKDKMMSLGLEFRTTLLLYGPPGCGKTSAQNIWLQNLSYRLSQPGSILSYHLFLGIRRRTFTVYLSLQRSNHVYSSWMSLMP